MTRDTAKQFWADYIKLACSGGTHLPMQNPADFFTSQAYIGKFDEMPDEIYEAKLKDIRELASFWDNNRTATAGNVLKAALDRTNISAEAIERIASILADTSVQSIYRTEGQNEKRLDGNHFSPDGRDITMDITPEQLVKQLQKTVIGQDKYIQDICTAVWMHSLKYNRFIRTGGAEAISHPKHNVLCLGQSGTGKTLAIQTLGKILDIPVLIEDASQLRGSGWKGNSVSSMIPRILELSGNDENKAKFTIVCLDEFDKIFQCQVSDNSFSPISNLLTFMGGALITHSESNNNNASLDTSNLLFICLGAFDGLKEIIQKRLSGGTCIGFGSDGYRETPEKNIFQLATKDDLNQYGIPWEIERGYICTIRDIFTMKGITDYRIIKMTGEGRNDAIVISPFTESEIQELIEASDNDEELEAFRRKQTEEGIRHYNILYASDDPICAEMIDYTLPDTVSASSSFDGNYEEIIRDAFLDNAEGIAKWLDDRKEKYLEFHSLDTIYVGSGMVCNDVLIQKRRTRDVVVILERKAPEEPDGDPDFIILTAYPDITDRALTAVPTGCDIRAALHETDAYRYGSEAERDLMDQKALRGLIH